MINKTCYKLYLSVKISSIDAARDAFAMLLKLPPDQQKEKFTQAQPYFIQTSKLCLSLNDLFDLRRNKMNLTKTTKEYTCFYQGLSVLESNNELMLKKLIKESMYSPIGIYSILNQFGFAFNIPLAYSLGLNPPIPQAVGQLFRREKQEVQPSFCPNKTAEIIEEIVKNNSCIQHVYVPDKWMLNRLNELGDKVIFKPFAEDDRFSFDMEKTKCE